VDSYEGKTPALGDHQARALLNAPNGETLKGKRDRAILSTLLYHGLRREELCLLKVRDLTTRRGVQHLRVHGKGQIPSDLVVKFQLVDIAYIIS
jgi:integrase